VLDIHNLVAGLIPAAGASHRMGQDKRRLRHRGKTLLENTIEALADGGANPVLLVLEPSSPCAQLPGVSQVTVVVNPAPERGMLSSIRVGIEALPSTVSAVAVLPGDNAFVPAAAVAALLRHYAEHRPLLLAPRYAQGRGHPLIIDRRLFEEATACDDAVGLRQLVRRREADLELLSLDYDGAEQDLDLPEHLERLDPT